MIVEFFVNRPVFASACSLLIVLIGAVCIPTLPVEKYPRLSPPEVTLSASYPGATAQEIEESVTIPLEQQLNGVEGMRYLTSSSGGDGWSTITVTFGTDRDIDLAAVDVQNRATAALGRLPRDVVAGGLTVTKSSSAKLMGVGFYTEHGELTELFISNYIELSVTNSLKRVQGVAKVESSNLRKYALRVWLDPLRMAGYGLTAGDVLQALREQNAQVSAGQVGQPPAPAGQMYQSSVQIVGRLQDVNGFEHIVLKVDPDGSAILLKDVARIEIGSEDYSSRFRFDGREASGIIVFLNPNANALEVDVRVRAELERLSHQFPAGLKYSIAFDPTIAVGDSIREVQLSLGIAVALVLAVIFIFLQDWRSALIPAITIPVSLIGTFAFIKAFGFSINTLTLFGMTLATGLVVDDAIIVVENVERHMSQQSQGGRAASLRAMAEVTSAVVATSLVLVAVVLPAVFFPGTIGRLYRQFAVTIAFSISISTFVALTLSPTLAALLMRQHRVPRFRILRAVNTAILWLQRQHRRSLSILIRRRVVALLCFAATIGLTGYLYHTTPTGFIPTEDQGYFAVMLTGPEGTSLDYTSAAMARVEETLLKDADVSHVFAVAGWSADGAFSNRALMYVGLRSLAERKSSARSLSAVLGRLRDKFAAIPEVTTVAFAPSAILGTSSISDLSFELLDQNNSPSAELARVTNNLIAEANKHPELGGLYSAISATSPLYLVRINREKTKNMSVPISEVSEALHVLMGSQYVNDFSFNGRAYRVLVQADGPFRASAKELEHYYVRSARDMMVPLSSLVDIGETTNAPVVNHFNLFRATELSAEAAPGKSTGQAMRALEEAARKVLPQGMSFEWSGVSWEERYSGRESAVIFGLGLMLVFLVLSAQYESFWLPLIILLVVPSAMLGALAAQRLRGLPNDVFCQIGLVLLIGLASKNAILIVEFGEQLRSRGHGVIEAALEAAQLRLRPILMTSMAFILGLLPLVLAGGAGAESRQSLGTPVFGGMVVSTIFSIYLVPIIYTTFCDIRALVGRILH